MVGYEAAGGCERGGVDVMLLELDAIEEADRRAKIACKYKGKKCLRQEVIAIPVHIKSKPQRIFDEYIEYYDWLWNHSDLSSDKVFKMLLEG